MTDTIVTPDFGDLASRQRAKLADSLQTIVDHIRANELEYEPHGFVLVLVSESNPRQCEVLNVGIKNVNEMERIAFSVKSRAWETLTAGKTVAIVPEHKK